MAEAIAGAAYAPDAVVALSQERGEPAWLTEKRAEAARAFDALPMPTTQLRPWKYTDVSDLVIDQFSTALDFAAQVTGNAPQGGYAGSIVDAVGDAALAAVVESHLGSLVPATEGKFVAANSSQWQRGAFVYAPRGQAFSEPVTVTLDASGVEANSAVFPRLLVVTEPASEVIVLVRSVSGDAPLLASQVLEIVAGADSRVKVVFDVDWGAQTREFTTVRVKTGRGADVQVATLAIGGALVKQTLEGLLEGEGSRARFRGVALGDGAQHFDFVTLQDHIGPKTQSDVEIKTALAGASRAIYYGVTRVEESGKGSAAEQENRNLLLSGQAKADSDPVLEILTNDVIRCGHGATVGPVDQDALFYLQSRGLDRRQALKLLVAGFFASVLSDVGDEALAEEVSAEVEQKLSRASI
jgi:Fe-S cluster assembly protein SufD